MNCNFHIQNPIVAICIAPHKCQCQRKLCIQCVCDHKVKVKQAVPIEIFQQQVLKKFQEINTNKTSETIQQRFRKMLFETENLLQKIWKQLQESIQFIYDYIEKNDQQYIDLINQDLAQASYSDIDKLVSILDGELLNDWSSEKNTYQMEMEKIRNCFNQEIQAFIYNSKQQIKKIQSLIKQQVEIPDHQQKKQLSDLFASVQDIDDQMFSFIIKSLQKEKITDCVAFLSTHKSQQINEVEKAKDSNNGINNTIYVSNILKNILQHEFNIKDYSQESYEKIREDLIKKIANDKKIIQFLKFLVHLSYCDDKFVRCGSNSLNLLIQMKAQPNNQEFKDLRIKDTSQIGGNWVRYNLSGLEFDYEPISEVNVYEFNKLEGHTPKKNMF